MGVRRKVRIRNQRRAFSMFAAIGVGLTLETLTFSTAEAASRQTLATATTSPGSEGVLLALGAGVLVLGFIGFFVFTWTRRKNRPGQCAEQREALELAERAVRYWDAARAHFETVENHPKPVDGAASEQEAQASLVAKAVEGMNNAIKQRDQCQMELIRCMASGPVVPVIAPVPSDSQPFFTPRNDGTTSSGTSMPD
jgi:hypothetical protein